MVMQAADLRNLNHLPETRILDRPGLWRILLKRQVGAIFMIMRKGAPRKADLSVLNVHGGAQVSGLPAVAATLGFRGLAQFDFQTCILKMKTTKTVPQS
jgi:hypothetical protein